MTGHTIPTIVRSVVEDLWNTGDLDLADQYFATTYVDHQGVVLDWVRGPESVKLAVVLAHLAFPGLLVAIDDLIVEGHLAEVHWTASTGPPVSTRGTAGRTSRSRLTGVTLARFAAEKIAESWTRWETTHDTATDDSYTRFAA